MSIALEGSNRSYPSSMRMGSIVRASFFGDVLLSESRRRATFSRLAWRWYWEEIRRWTGCTDGSCCFCREGVQYLILNALPDS